MTIAVLKHGAKWDLISFLFGIKAATFEKRVSTMIKSISVHAYRRFVQQYASRFTMERLIGDKTTFKTYKMCRYATDVTFQQTFRPGRTSEESRKYFSGKHKLYGFRVEASVLPNELALHVSKHYPVSVADIVIMREMLHVHDSELEKAI